MIAQASWRAYDKMRLLGKRSLFPTEIHPAHTGGNASARLDKEPRQFPFYL
jgi:hypothetical protein